MKWITRRNLGVDRTACPWLIRKFIDAKATFEFVESDRDPDTLDGHTFDMRGGEYGHEGKRCTFEVLVRRHGLDDDRALVEMGKIVRAADVPPSRTRRPEGAGLDAIMRGSRLAFTNDHEKLRLTAAVY